MTDSNTTGIAVYNNAQALVPVMDSAAKSALADDIESIVPKFPIVKIPGSGGKAWNLPGDEVSKTITGVIVFHHPVNALWVGEFSGAGTPPQCSAIDGKKGVGDPGVRCISCAFNQWGSGTDKDGNPTRGKKCKNMRRVYVQVAGQALPWCIVLPPGSLKGFEEYAQNSLMPRGLATRHVVTEIGLGQTKNPGGIEYSYATFRVAGLLPAEMLPQVDAYSYQIKEQALASAVTADDSEAVMS